MDSIAVEKVQVGPIQTNCYRVKCTVTGYTLVIDPGDDPLLTGKGLSRLDCIVYTHGHFDHVCGAASLIRKYSPRTLIHSADCEMMAGASRAASQWGFSGEQPPPPGGFLHHGEELQAGDLRFSVIHTPGHSPGSICLYGHGVLFSGDTLFAGSIGRTDLPGSSSFDMERSLIRLLTAVDDHTKVYPGHGPSTTVSRERKTNPFLRF